MYNVLFGIILFKSRLKEEHMTEIVLYKRVGKNVKKYRMLYCINKSKLTQEGLAKKIGCCSSLIGALESSKISQGVSLYNLYNISKVLGVPIEKFLE